METDISWQIALATQSKDTPIHDRNKTSRSSWVEVDIQGSVHEHWQQTRHLDIGLAWTQDFLLKLHLENSLSHITSLAFHFEVDIDLMYEIMRDMPRLSALEVYADFLQGSSLASLSHLRTLRITTPYNKPTQVKITHKYIEHLDLQGGVLKTSPFTSLPLKTLRLNYIQFTNENLRNLLQHMPFLEALELNHCSTPEGTVDLRNLTLPSLSQFIVTGDTDVLLGDTTLPSLRHLKLAGCEGNILYNLWKDIPLLTSLLLPRTLHQDMRSLLAQDRCHALKDLSLYSEENTLQDFEKMIPHLTQLQSLSIQQKKDTTLPIQQLATSPLKKLQTLSLSHAHIQAKEFEQLFSTHTLHHLKLERVTVMGTGTLQGAKIDRISAYACRFPPRWLCAQHIPNITQLMLQSCFLSDGGEGLKGIIEQGHLYRLNLEMIRDLQGTIDIRPLSKSLIYLNLDRHRERSYKVEATGVDWPHLWKASLLNIANHEWIYELMNPQTAPSLEHLEYSSHNLEYELEQMIKAYLSNGPIIYAIVHDVDQEKIESYRVYNEKKPCCRLLVIDGSL